MKLSKTEKQIATALISFALGAATALAWASHKLESFINQIH
tara:strand:- start:16883 stop:17005 length:123 start_codon:yes stop_codon:yes gene_type:complete